jgi:glycosyltransferase involved in cell wall biosynthesis
MKTGKDKLNIVYAGRFNESENLSGPEKTAKRIFTEYSKENNGRFIQYFFDGNKYSLWKKLFGKEIKHINNSSVVYTLGLFKIFRILNEINPDIIHIITFERFAAVIIFYGMFHKIKIIYNEHGAVTFGNYEIKKTPLILKLKDKFCEKMFLSRSDRIIFLSEGSIDVAEKYFKVDESKSVILPNGVDSVFSAKPGDNRNNQTLKAVLLFKNELHRSGLDFIKKFTENFNGELEIYIITDSTIALKHNEHVIIRLIKLMAADKLSEFYKDKDIFLSLNQYDTFSISSAEAMASGLIPVITKQTGISRYIENGYNGFTVDYGNLTELSDSITKILMLSTAERDKIRQNAVNVSGSLSWNSVYEMYYNLYKGIV